MKHLLPLLLLLLTCQTVLAQVEMPEEWVRTLEIWAEEEESSFSVEELSEFYGQMTIQPIQINDTITRPLKALFFITPQQEENLLAYIRLHGELRSIGELVLINGFDTNTVELLRPIITFEHPSEVSSLRLRDILRHGHHHIVMGANTTFERARGYREEIYEGDPYRLYMRYQFHYSDRVQLLLAADKDPGEALFAKSQPQGFDFYNFYLMVNQMGPVKRAIVGRYRLQFGQGLTFWSGFAPYSGINTTIYRHAQGIRPASSFAEYDYQQGGAVTLGIAPHIEATAFYSYVNRDGSEQSLTTSGYHRYVTELAKKDALSEQLFGAHLAYRSTFAEIGVTACRTLLSISITPADHIYNAFSFEGSSLSNFGIDGALRIHRLLLFGELSMSSNLRFAGIAGLEFQMSNDHRFSAYYRDYAADYWNLHASGLGQGSTQNEQGLCFIWQSRLPWKITMLASADLFRFPWMRYNSYAPSDGHECRVQLSRPIARNTTLTVMFRSKENGRNASGETLQTYTQERTYRRQLQGNLQWTHQGWQLVTRIGYAWAGGELSQNSEGLLLYQDIRYKPEKLPLSIAARFALFDIDDYDARMYAIESDFLYEYSSSLLMYQGLRTYLLVKYDITPDLSIGAKYGITQYANRNTVGSGYEQIPESHKQTLKVQIRWKF